MNAALLYTEKNSINRLTGCASCIRILISGLFYSISLMAAPLVPEDSVEIIVSGDTLKLPRNYAISYPEHAENDDSTNTNHKKSERIDPKHTESGLAATGSISRGIQISSNASVSLQSSMYLKIKGNLNQDYMVSGVLTEKTSPLQPIGNTRRLNDFDRVIITVTGPKLTAQVGDIDLRQENGRFGHLDRSIEGLDIKTGSGAVKINTSLGFSYGKYHLQQIQGKDGKQGPYRLQGRDGEKFIIIIAGSEKVKLDDHLLQRGETDDYIIDYNAAEITFTRKRILSSNSRISVEYEYVPDIYLASYSFGKQLFHAGFSIGDRQNSSFYLAGAWQELKDDGKNPLGNIDVDELKSVFVDLDDDIQSAQVSTIVQDTVAGDYRLTEDGKLEYLGEGQGDHRADFHFVGLEKGVYRRVLESSGSYFVYDTLQGEYLPSKHYFAPGSQSVFSIQGQASAGMLHANIDMGLSNSVNNLYANNIKIEPRRAWDVNLSTRSPNFEILLGDKYYDSGFVAHGALESLEYYRKWQLSPRNKEEEHLNYGHLRLGKIDRSYVKSRVSSLQREGQQIGKQIMVEAKTPDHALFHMVLNSALTDIGDKLSQEHVLFTELKLSKVRADCQISVEDRALSPLFPSNDHLKSGAGLAYSWSPDHTLALHYDRRLDYRLASEQGSFLNQQNYNEWSDRRQDWSAEYRFSKLMNLDGTLNMKYREHQATAQSLTRYYLGNIDFNGSGFDQRLSYSEKLIIDEEHIPKYDYHYVEVDTGYGNYSFDPYLRDYIPVGGGRFVRQRVFSDIEEQVRKVENKSRLQFVTTNYGKPEKVAFRVRIKAESRSRLQVITGDRIQNQSHVNLDVNFQTGSRHLFKKLNYYGRITDNESKLNNYGNEDSYFLEQGLSGEMAGSAKRSSKAGILFEFRKRNVTYNPLATEDWTSVRPFLEFNRQLSSKQKMKMILKTTEVDDLVLDQIYRELYLSMRHDLRYGRRGRVEQKLLLSKIEADVDGIPYSIFSGRQPGTNWKYSINSRYTFSSSFRLSLNYSIQKRGPGKMEQYLRVEGRTQL